MSNGNRDAVPDRAGAAPARRPSFAVIGSGIAGLTAAHVLSATGEVTLYEADHRLGGHAHTHELAGDGGGPLAVDSGFIVYNERTYPLLSRLFAELDVPTRETGMSMSVRCDGCGLEYAGGRGASGLFAVPGTAIRPGYLRMLASVPRFHRAALALLAGESQCTLGTFLRDHGFSPYFARHFVLPLVSTVWSCPGALATHYPARHLFRFLANHGMLSVTGAPTWRTVVGGSRGYVERVAKGLHRVLVRAPVHAVVRHADGVDVHDRAGGTRRHDGVVVATHPAQALALLDAPTDAERDVLGAFTYARSEAVLHTDTSLLPTRAHASWNCRLPSCATSAAGVAVSYDMSRLQHLPGPTRYVVTLNDDGAIDPATTLATMTYEHPVFTVEAVAAQRRLPELDRDRVAFAGAYHGWGFHEDGCRAGVAAARSLGGRW